MSAGLWLRIRNLLMREPPRTTRDIAHLLDEIQDDVGACLRAYAKRGLIIRVVRRDHAQLHWRLAVRDPRRYPIAGDRLRANGDTRSVTHVQHLRTGALRKVFASDGRFWMANRWRAWAVDARVLKRGSEVRDAA